MKQIRASLVQSGLLVESGGAAPSAKLIQTRPLPDLFSGSRDICNRMPELWSLLEPESAGGAASIAPQDLARLPRVSSWPHKRIPRRNTASGKTEEIRNIQSVLSDRDKMPCQPLVFLFRAPVGRRILVSYTFLLTVGVSNGTICNLMD